MVNHPKLHFDPSYLLVAAVLVAAAFLVPARFMVATLALAIAAVVLSPMPRGTRGVTFAVMVGLATGIASVNLFAIGIFQGPITREFGWTQTQYALVTLIGTVVVVISSPIIGRLLDRQGARRWALWGIVLFALALISLYWLTPNLLHFYFVFGLMPIIGAGTSSVAYSRVVARWFDRRRGQAFGAALAGIGIGGAVLSAYSQWLIDEVGWRGAYVGLALLSIAFTLPLVFWKLREAPAEVGLGVDGESLIRPQGSVSTSVSGAPVAAFGYTSRESRRLPRFWIMFGAFLLLGFAIGGVMIPLVPILRAQGVTPQEAASVLGWLAVALILGRAFAGFLMDRFFAPFVAAAIVVFPIVGVTLLAMGATGPAAIVAAICVGLAAGAELDVIAYLTTRYFGTSAYAENYGWQYAAWTAGSGTAPILTNRVYDLTGSHTPVLWFYVAVFAVAAVLIARLGAYPSRLPGQAEVPPGPDVAETPASASRA